ncbi:MAG TPA: MarR family winged helix-turn-helix transcriptional regulator [Stellaceae bacterium]|jgi:DNA-binding MarR family transcriptional regulator|nr:MarR family winged helix-turn-helix transcriptional regulator [Stellaceae bacterium]
MPRKPTAGDDGEATRNSLNASVEFGPLAHWLGFNLRMAQAAAFQAFARRSSKVGVQPGRFATLTLIAANPGITQTALSRANGRDKSTLTPLISDLVRRRLVRRTRDRGDRRTYRLTLTAAGERLLAELTDCARAHEEALDRLVGRDRARFLQLLKRISAEL